MLVSVLHPLNIFEPMLVQFPTNIALVILGYEGNVVDICVIHAGMDTSLISLHPPKALVPILVTLAEILTLVSALHP